MIVQALRGREIQLQRSEMTRVIKKFFLLLPPPRENGKIVFGDFSGFNEIFFRGKVKLDLKNARWFVTHGSFWANNHGEAFKLGK